jgi:hypothetical protein
MSNKRQHLAEGSSTIRMSAAAAGTDDASYVSVNESFGAFANLMNGQQSVCKMDDIPREALLAHALSTGALSEVVYVKATQLDGKTIAVFPAKNSTLGTVKKLVAESSGIAVAAQSFLDTDGATGGDCDDKALADDAVIGVSCTLTLVVDDTTLPFAWDSNAELLQGNDPVYRLPGTHQVVRNIDGNMGSVPIVPIMVMPEEDGVHGTVHTVSFKVSNRIESATREHAFVGFGLARITGHYFAHQKVGYACYSADVWKTMKKWCLHEIPLHDEAGNDLVCRHPCPRSRGTVFTIVFDPTKGTLNFLRDGVRCGTGGSVGEFCVPGQQLQWVVWVPSPDVVVEIVPNILCNVTA